MSYERHSNITSTQFSKITYPWNNSNITLPKCHQLRVNLKNVFLLVHGATFVVININFLFTTNDQTSVKSPQNAWRDEYVQLANGNWSSKILNTFEVLDYTLRSFLKNTLARIVING